MSPPRGTSEHVCEECGITVLLNQRPDYGTPFRCRSCTQPRIYNADVEDQEER